MRKKTDKAIILARSNYAERDRIVTALTRENGKIKLIAKGTRSAKSKLAGGIEVFSVSSIGWVEGRSDLFTLTSSRLDFHFNKLVEDYDVIVVAYEFIKTVNKVNEVGHGQDFYQPLFYALSALDHDIAPEIVSVWFNLRVLKNTGLSIELQKNSAGARLEQSERYSFNYDRMCFDEQKTGTFSIDHLKALRYLEVADKPKKINSNLRVLAESAQFISQLIKNHLLN